MNLAFEDLSSVQQVKGFAVTVVSMVSAFQPTLDFRPKTAISCTPVSMDVVIRLCVLIVR